MAYRKSSGIIPALLFIGVVLVAVFYAAPLSNKVEELALAKSEKKEQLGALQKELTELKTFQAELPADSAQITRKIPVDLKEDELILLMEKMAAANRISFSSLGFGPGSREVGKVSPVTISTSFEGTFKDLINFVAELERARERKFLVRGISVSLAPLDTGVAQAGANAEIAATQLPPGTKYLEQPLIAKFTLQLEAYYQGVIR